MSNILPLTARDRVLVIAPHPDDESIACGGLLLAARDAGAARRVVTLTDGDNNPWPQRWIEKRWRIDSAARTRWGARRRAESHAAQEKLGVTAADRFFLGLPDSGLTALLMRGAQTLLGPLRDQIVAFRPTYLALPALADRHPDHSAAHIAVRLALRAADPAPQLLAYRVHGENHAQALLRIDLSETQRAIKRDAIASHHTQVTLSGKRFLAFAAPVEYYDDVVTAARVDHPLNIALGPEHGVDLRVRKRDLRGDLQALILLTDEDGEMVAWRLRLDGPGGRIDVHDTRSDDRVVAVAQWHREQETWTLSLPLPDALRVRTGFAKLARRRPGLVVFDRYGWQIVGLDKNR